MASICPQGHTSGADDYCDVCGAPIAAGAGLAAPAPVARPTAPVASAPAGTGAAKTCPHCQAVNAADSLFCEVCGYDFTTGQLPAPPPVLQPPAGVAVNAAAAAPTIPGALAPPPADPTGFSGWVAELWIDPDWYAAEGDEAVACPSAGPPRVVPLPSGGALVGRRSKSRAIFPEVDCGSDSSVSRRHAQLTLDGGRWFVEDLESTNGTFVGAAGAPLPKDPIPPGRRRELGDSDRVYVGSWTRLVVRRATDDERGAAGSAPATF